MAVRSHNTGIIFPHFQTTAASKVEYSSCLTVQKNNTENQDTIMHFTEAAEGTLEGTALLSHSGIWSGHNS